MKKVFALLFSLILSQLLLNSCSDGMVPEPGEKFNTLEEEKKKAYIENAGIRFNSVLSDAKTIETIDIIRIFMNYAEESSLDSILTGSNSKVISSLTAIEKSMSGETTINELFTAMLNPAELTAPPFDIQEIIDKNAGTYTWNRITDSWDISYGGNTITFLFPARRLSNNNNAILKVYNYQGVTLRNPFHDQYSGNLPVSFSLSLTVDDKSFISMHYGAAYTAEGIPSNVSATLNIEKYLFRTVLTNDSETIFLHNEFLDNTQLVIDIKTVGNGNITEENYQNNNFHINETRVIISGYIFNPEIFLWQPVFDTLHIQKEGVSYEEMINSAGVIFQLYNIAVSGEINLKMIKILIGEVNEAIDPADQSNDSINHFYLDLLKQYIHLEVKELNNDIRIALLEPYIKRVITDEYSSARIGFRVIFDDNSAIDASAYFGKEFDKFTDELNNMLRLTRGLP